MKINLWEWFQRNKQTCFIYCTCGHELIATATRLNSSWLTDPGIAVYDCPACGERSAWDFVHYPVPIRLKDNAW